MHTSVIQSPQAMSDEKSYRPRSPELPGLTEQHQHQPQQPPPRLGRLPSYQIQEPTLPKGYSFSPRGSYDASPFFTQPLQQTPNQYSGAQQTHSYSNQSPPRFTPASLPDQPQIFSPITYTESPQRHQASTVFQNSPFQSPQSRDQPTHQQQAYLDDMARLRSRKPVNYNEDQNGSHYEEPIPVYPQTQSIPQIPQQPQQLQQMQHLPQQQIQNTFMQQPIVYPQSFQPPPPQQHQQQQPLQLPPPPPTHPLASPMPPVDVKTKFPVARIKRIMQADEDVGKVAQATPTAVSKALEMFMIALVTKGAAEAKNNNSKRVTATHLKQALLTDSQFDFLNEICESVPDEGTKSSKGRAKSEAKSEDSDEDMGAAPKKKAKASRKKKGGDDDGSD